jgi:hypothetical protein
MRLDDGGDAETALGNMERTALVERCLEAIQYHSIKVVGMSSSLYRSPYVASFRASSECRLRLEKLTPTAFLLFALLPRVALPCSI